MTRKALGKGLDALLPTVPLEGLSSPDTAALRQLDIERIKPNAYQPRIRFEQESLDQLADSIRSNGVLQPIVVRPTSDAYEIIAGERRWRAAQRAGLHRLPALIQSVSNQEMVQLALIENLQRDDLSAIEEAHAFQLLIDEFQLTQEEVAQRVSRSRSAIANTLRLLKLPKRLQEYVLSGDLSMGHARAILPLPPSDQIELAALTIARGLSVRDVERRAKSLLQPEPPKPATRKDPNVRQAEERLEDRWQTKVEIRRRGRSGQILIHFTDEDELDRLFSALTEET